MHSSTVLKDLWPLRERDETEAACNIPGKMRTSRVSAYYSAEYGTEEAPKVDATESKFSLENLHKRLILKTKCNDLRTAVGPYNFLQSILHAMIGHYKLYMDGWLYRDVNDTSIFLLPEPKNQELITEFEFIKGIKECVGIISDGHQTIEWRQPGRELEMHHSGALLYMSMRLTKALADGQSALHTVVDDLESFFWVILRILLSIGNERNSLTRDENLWLGKLLTSDDAHRVCMIKAWILLYLEMSLEANNSSAILKVFRSFLMAILPIVRESFVAVEQMIDSGLNSDNVVASLTALGGKYYELYFKAFIDALPLLPKTWDEVFTDPI